MIIGEPRPQSFEPVHRVFRDYDTIHARLARHHDAGSTRYADLRIPTRGGRMLMGLRASVYADGFVVGSLAVEMPTSTGDDVVLSVEAQTPLGVPLCARSCLGYDDASTAPMFDGFVMRISPQVEPVLLGQLQDGQSVRLHMQTHLPRSSHSGYQEVWDPLCELLELRLAHRNLGSTAMHEGE